MQTVVENKIVPTLRFREFGDEWKKKKLGEFCSFTQGIQLPQSEQEKNYKDGYIRYLYIRDFFNNSFDCYVKDEYPNKIIEPHQIMMVNTGNTSGKAFRGQRGVLSNNCFKVSWDESSFDADYIFLYLTSNFLQNQIKRFFNSGGQPHLGHKNVAILPFSFPSLPEQQKIAAFLSSVDEKLQQLGKKKSLLEDYKKGVMQKIFSQELRFKDANGNNYLDWEEKKLGEVLDYEQPTKYIVESSEYKSSYKTPVLTAGKSFILGYTNETNGIFKKTPVIIFDDFTMSNQFVDFPFKVKSSAMKILTAVDESVDMVFVYKSMQMIKYPKGDEHKRFWISEYSKIKIKYPCIEEQQKIATFLSAIDAKIDLVNTQIENTQAFKKGLLQQMFV